MILTGSPTRWEQMLAKPLAQRLEQAPEELVTFMAQYNKATGNPAHPKSAVATADLFADTHAAVEELPPVIKNQLELRLLGIFFMNGLGSSAITDVIAYANGDPLGAVVAIDVEAFSRRKANEWATWRENTAFSPAPRIRLDVRIAHSEKDDRKGALQYVLLHEFGHVMASASDVMPNWWEERISSEHAGRESFPQLAWQLESDGTMVPRAGQDFPLRDRITLYAPARLSGEQIASIYQDLDNTVFPTLYAASNVHEDFAESFATYVHTVLLEKLHEVLIYQDDRLLASYRSFWATPRSRAKAAFFEAFLARPPAPFPRRREHAAAAKLCSEIIDRSATAFLGLAPFLHLSIESGDLRHVAEELLAQAAQEQDNAVLWMNLATAFFSIRQRRLGLAMHQQALFLRRQFHLPASLQPARCHVLMLMAPGDVAENMPLDCLLQSSAVDLTLYYATPEAPLPPEPPAHDVLLVGLTDTDKNRPILKTLESMLASWGKPVINRPQSIPNVERNTASVLLQGVPGLLMPLTHQVARASLVEFGSGTQRPPELPDDCPFPIILRPVGSHAGRDLVRIDDAAGIASYLAAVPDGEFYLSRFIDYSGPDGLFRKYRIALIAGQPFACHMAISSHWMIHYVNAGMYADSEKRAEEATFMANFDEFARRHQIALDAIFQRCGLDYVCIDCAESRDGQLLIFEVDHAMVVHAMDPEDLFPYKQAHMLKVKNAFEDFLFGLSACQAHLSYPYSTHEIQVS
jgi:glutathione synthase/RimK-type ligase-like ATP-grasp enzyme